MSDLHSRLDALVPAGAPPSIADLEARAAVRRARRRHRLGALGAIVLIAGGIVTWRTIEDEPTITQVVTTEPTTPPTTVAADAPIQVPIIEHEWCESTTPAVSGSERSQGYGIEPRIYAESVAPIAVQVIGTPGEIPDRYTVVLRVPDDGYQARTWEASVEPTGVGHARTVLDDGTALYFRSRGVEQEELQDLVSTVTPRTLASPIPGVDVTNLAASQILAEEDGLSWDVAGSTTTCQHDFGSSGGPAEVYVSVWDGPLATVLAGALDAPPPILMRMQSDGTLLHMWGGPLRFPEQSGATMTLDDVMDASNP